MIYITSCEQAINSSENSQFEDQPQGVIEDAHNVWESVTDEGNNQHTEVDEVYDMPEIEIISDYGVEVQISNDEEYEGFISRLEEFTDYTMLWVDLGATDTTVYLDEILTYNNFEFLQIKNGGSISFKDTQILNYTIHTIELSHIFSIKKGLLSHIISGESLVQYNLVIELDNRYLGKLPIEKLLDYNDCMNVILVWDDNTEGGALLDVQENMESLKEWDYLQSVQETEGGCIKGIYSLNDGDYSYTSYEFYNHYEESGTEIYAAFICVKDTESNGQEYFDIIDVPIDKFSGKYVLDRGTLVNRLRVLYDLNFDGHTDLIFDSQNNDSLSRYGYIIFLWDDEKQRFILNESAPDYFNQVDPERKRLTYSTALSAFDEDYYIYEYRENMFTEKHIEIRTERMSGSRTLQYFEDGKLVAQLELVIDEDGSRHFFYEEIGGAREEVQVESGLLFREVSELYFPEFDFYRVG